ncbi:MAG: c-type cytochrome [Planctomycetes bacterium]|nr:c-type cytochrome [Planctomycetota bacterium]
MLGLLGGELRAETKLPLQFQKGDRIAILGNGLADRMQHDGWLETFLQARYPKQQLVVRHLGFTGDELTIRMRSKGFGSPAEWLKRTQATVVFAFFGWNESFRDEPGLGKFKKNLADFVSKIRSSDREGIPTRRLVLFSPIAYENIGDRLLPQGDKLNGRLLAYTNAMAEVAKKLEVPYVDLFHPTQELYRRTSGHLTMNGIHLNDAGNRGLAEIIDQALFITSTDDLTDNLIDDELSKIRYAVREKNFLWFQRYRTTDGYSIFGDRKTTGGSLWTPDNEKVMDREMEVLDVMTANRDQRIWATAEGRAEMTNREIDDSNTPPLIPVASNKPGPLGDGTYPFLGGEEALEKMTVPKGMAVNLFASEEQFPVLQNPVQTAIDTKGRLWVAAWPSYPHWRPKDEMNDKLLILEDTDHDGRADTCKVFADGLHNPTGFEFYNGGVYVAQVPDIWFFKDTDGDDVADVRRRVVSGIDSADTHHSINSFVLGPGGGLYFQEGTFHRTQVETPHGPPVRVADAGVFRYDPRSQEFLAYSSYRFANPHGHVFTYWGDDIVHDGTMAVPYFGPSFSGRMIHPAKHSGAPTIFKQRTRPCSATAILSSSHFPEKNRDTLLVCNVIGVQGVMQYELEEDGAGLKGVETEPLLMSSDTNFRPVDLEVGSDGAVYILDWQNPLIGHLQHNLRDSNRDHRHGRIYRVSCKDRELIDAPAIADQPIEKLFALLKNRDNGIRYRAKIELSRHPAQQVKAACEQWIDTLDSQSPQYEHHLLEALWVQQHHHLINEPLLRRLLRSDDHHVRAAAAHVLRAWREDIADAMTLIEQLVHDEHPRVRLAGILICSDIDSAEAAELALETAKYPQDKFLNYALRDATKTLAPVWKQALASGKPFCRDNPQAIAYLQKNSRSGELLKLGNHAYLYEGLVALPDTKASVRLEALKKLAASRGIEPLALLLELIQREESKASLKKDVLPQLAKLLTRFEPESLRSAESQFLRLAIESKHQAVRQGSLAAIARIDSSAERVGQLVGETSNGLTDLLESLQAIPESKIRALFYDRVRALMQSTGNDELVTKAVDAMAHIPGHESEKLADLLAFVEKNQHRANALAAIRAIPQTHWQSSHASRLLTASLEYIASIAPAKRAEKVIADEVQLALKFVDLLPRAEREATRTSLKSFDATILRLGTMPHRMSYDREKMVVQAGGTVRLIFKNVDNMPHNFVLTQPGAMAKIGQRAESEATLPDTIARHYVPDSPDVLLSSRLLQPQEQQVLIFQAPKKPGIYPYVCTYPGHWRRMYGALYVVGNVEAYEANPASYLTSYSITVQDELLKFNRPLRKWTYEELAPALATLSTDRSFERGQLLFQVASCAACHTVKEGQRRFAPDLALLDLKRTPEYVLRSLLEPSKEINEKYQTSQFVMDTGKMAVGFIVEETPSEVILMVDPLASCAPTILDKSEIEERIKSSISLMPSGLLDRLTEEEIMEICAYVVSRCNSNAPVYQPAESQ